MEGGGGVTEFFITAISDFELKHEHDDSEVDAWWCGWWLGE